MQKNSFRKINVYYTTQFLKIGSISGMYYTIPGRKTKRIIICGIGAPLPPDDGLLSDAEYILKYETDLYVPDYIGYGRSEGKFTPQGCVKTFLALYDAFSKGCVGVSNYKNVTREMKYQELHFMGRSFGGIYVLLLPKFNKSIKNICSIFPVVDWKTLGKGAQPEETIEGFLKAMTGDGYKYLYRGILEPRWKKHFAGKDQLNPIDNIRYLDEAKIFIAHGRYDINIYFGNSEDYFDKLTQQFPNKKKQYKFKLYPYDHSFRTSNKAIVDYLNWMGVPKNESS